jgi:hypothetical protein
MCPSGRRIRDIPHFLNQVFPQLLLFIRRWQLIPDNEVRHFFEAAVPQLLDRISPKEDWPLFAVAVYISPQFEFAMLRVVDGHVVQSWIAHSQAISHPISGICAFCIALDHFQADGGDRTALDRSVVRF